MKNKITLNHGNGGIHTERLIKDIFYKHFGNSILNEGVDSALLNKIDERICFTTDSFVVKPIFFPGGDIGKIAMCGTINDLVVSGATPLYISAAFIIEEGFPIEDLEKIVISMSNIAKISNVYIVTGDTKVVERGSVDGIYINTTGIGKRITGYEKKQINKNDKILVTGGIAEHGISIAISRYNINTKTEIISDCMSLIPILPIIEKYKNDIKIMRDPTRGGVSTILNEISNYYQLGIEVNEKDIPIKKQIRGICNILGLDPMYLACEGRMIIVASENSASNLLDDMKKIKFFEDSKIIGNVLSEQYNNIVIMNTEFGGKRIIEPLYEDFLPRIC